MSRTYLNKLLLVCLLAWVIKYTNAQSGNNVYSGAEMANFGTISLSTPGGQSWTTDRLATPGYFSVVNTAAYSNPSDANNIDGYVKKYGNQSYTFPVGTGSDLRTLSISAPAIATDAYATAWISGDPSGNTDPTGPNGGPHDITSVTFPINTVSAVGQWDWQAGIDMGATGDGVNLMITVSIPDMTAFALTPNLRLVGWNGTSWIDLSGASTASGNTENSTLVGYMQSGISSVAIGSVWWILSVKLNSFTAQEKDCSAALSWTASNEEGLTGYEIERSENGFSFTKAGQVSANGNATKNNYSFIANQIQSESYYRLKMINKDGSFTYSEVKYVKTSCKTSNSSVKIYSNPVTQGFIMLEFNSEHKGSVQVILLNDAGQQLINRNTALSLGNNIIRFNVNHIPKGIYFIKMLTEDNQQAIKTQKVVIE